MLMPVKAAEIIVFVFYSIIFSACLLEVLFPKWCWKTFVSWKATKEPSKAYFLGKRVAGIIMMLIIIAITSAPTLIAYLDK